MGHEWVIEVLSDLKSYADRHGLVALAAKADETLAIARVEIDAADAQADDSGEAPQERTTAPGGHLRRN